MMELSTFLSTSIVVAALVLSCSDAFQPCLRQMRSTTILVEQKTSRLLPSALYSKINDLPSIEQLSKDPFMKQVEYGSILTTQLLQIFDKNESDATTADPTSSTHLEELIKSQLSHPEGIRGFMVSYLTAEESPADQDDIPTPLTKALQSQFLSETARKDLVSLTCMNVVMPTAMVTMHQTAELSESSAKTSERGIRILQALSKFEDENNHQVGENNDDSVLSNVQAIFKVANQQKPSDGKVVEEAETSGDSYKLVKYWEDFFEKWGYQDTQRVDIAKAMEAILQ